MERGTSSRMTPLLPSEDATAADPNAALVRVFLTVTVVSLGSSFQFGFGQGIVNNLYLILPLDLEKRGGHGLSLFAWSLVVSGFAVGGLFGSLLATLYASSYGRRTVLHATNVVVVASSALFMLGAKWQTVFTGRVLCGVVSGVVTAVVPRYFAEIAPARVRGAVGLAHQLGVSAGLVASLALTTPSLGLLGSNELWRYVFLVPMALALIESSVLPLCPESPAYLCRHAGTATAAGALSELHPSVEAARELQQMRHAERQGPSDASRYSVAELLRAPQLRKQLFVSLVLQLSMQLCGIDSLLYYSTMVLNEAGLTDAPLASTCLGAANIVTSVLAVSVVDKAGRRTLFLSSLSALCVSYALLALGLVQGFTSLTLVAVLSVLVAFAIGPGCVAWFIIADIFPPYARDAAMTLGVSLTWLANALLAIAFPALHEALGGYTFLLFALAAAASGAFTWRFVPETRGKTSAQIAHAFEMLE